MTLIAGYALSFVGIVYSIFAFRRVGIAVTPLLLVSMFLLNACLVSQNIIYSEFARVWSNYGALNNGTQNIQYLLLILLIYAVPVLIVHRRLFDSAEGLKRFLVSLRGQALLVGSSVMALFALVHIYVLDLEAVMSAQEYLFLASRDALAIVTPATLFIQSFYKFAGLLCFLLLAAALISRSMLTVAIIAFPCVWFSLYELAGHSRFATVYFGAAGGILLASRRPVLGAAFVALAMMALINALFGRNSGAHGLTEIGGALSQFQAAEGAQLLRFYTNIFEGVFVQGDAFYYFDVAYATVYKVLSFSPVPSFIDGFSSRALPYAVRLHTFVPMGATGEVYLFGPGFMLLYWATIGVTYFCALRLAIERRFGLFLLSISLFLLCTYLQFTYPVRWIYRFLVLLIALFFMRKVIERRGFGFAKVADERHATPVRTH